MSGLVIISSVIFKITLGEMTMVGILLEGRPWSASAGCPKSAAIEAHVTLSSLSWDYSLECMQRSWQACYCLAIYKYVNISSLLPSSAQCRLPYEGVCTDRAQIHQHPPPPNLSLSFSWNLIGKSDASGCICYL